jgi:hypothetical protein
MELLEAITSNGSPKNGIYEPERRMLNYLAQVQVPDAVISELAQNYPDLLEIEDGQELALPREQTIVARAWLKANGCYGTSNLGSVMEYRYRVSRKRLLSMVFGHQVLSPPIQGSNLAKFGSCTRTVVQPGIAESSRQ